MTGTGDMADTRIEYGDRTNTGIAVNWSAEGDTVLIFCPQASAPSDKSVEYVVKPTEGEPSLAASVDKTEAETVGLRWGDENNHYFYAFYPASELKGTTAEEEEGIITADIPVLQTPISWPTTGEIGNQYLPIPPTADRTYFGEPDLTNSFMYAYNLIDKAKLEAGTPVSLQFHNLVTVLDITIPGPENAGDEAITVTNISVDVVSGTTKTLTGLFEFHIKNGGTDADGNPLHIGDCVPLTGDKVSNRLSIPCYNPSTTEYIKVGYNETLNVKAYVIPDTEKTTAELKRQFKITVSTMNGAKSKTLDEGVIEVQKVNRILLPNLVAGGVDYWMSNLDPDIYITELSIPGSHQSASTTFQGKIMNLTTQLDAGIRAFSFQITNYTNDILGGGANKGFEIVGNDELRLETCINTIGKWLESAANNGKKEFAVVTLNYKQEGGEYIWGCDNYMSELADFVDKSSYIYAGEITEDLTIEDVKGKIVVITRYNDNAKWGGWGNDDYYMYQKLNETDKRHSLYAEYTNNVTSPNFAPMNYGTSNFDQALEYGPTGNLRLMYQDLTGVVSSGSGFQGTVAQKQQQMIDMFEQGAAEYQKGAHNMWFLNNLGGYTDEENTQTGAQSHALVFNPAAVDYLQKRTENASTGIVLMNFADRKGDGGGATYKSDYLITTVIDNNFKFALRKKPSSTTTRGTYVRPRTGSDGWDEE